MLRLASLAIIGGVAWQGTALAQSGRSAADFGQLAIAGDALPAGFIDLADFGQVSVFAKLGASLGRLDVLAGNAVLSCTAFVVDGKTIAVPAQCLTGADGEAADAGLFVYEAEGALAAVGVIMNSGEADHGIVQLAASLTGSGLDPINRGRMRVDPGTVVWPIGAGGPNHLAIGLGACVVGEVGADDFTLGCQPPATMLGAAVYAPGNADAVGFITDISDVTRVTFASPPDDAATQVALKSGPETVQNDESAGGPARETEPDGEMVAETQPADAADKTASADPVTIETVAKKASAPAPVTACDTLAAGPDDPDRVAPGVYRSSVPEEAIEACREAVAAYPEEARFHLQLGHALLDNDRPYSAVAEFRTAADLGSRHAHVRLGIAHTSGRGAIVNLDEAARQLDLVADLPGAHIARGNVVRQIDPDDPAIREHWRAGAEAGSVYGHRVLGLAFLNGWGGPKDLAAAQAEFERGAAAGDPEAMRQLAKLLLDGTPSAADKQRARELLQRGHEMGYAGATQELAYQLSSFGKLPTEDATSVALYRTSAEGEAWAERLLARRRLDDGTEEGIQQALALYTAAANHGDTHAVNVLARSKAGKTPIAAADGTLLVDDEDRFLWKRTALTQGSGWGVYFLANNFDKAFPEMSPLSIHYALVGHALGDVDATGVAGDELAALAQEQMSISSKMTGSQDHLFFPGIQMSDGFPMEMTAEYSAAMAVPLLMKSAAAGQDWASSKLMHIFDIRGGPIPDARRAVKWFKRFLDSNADTPENARRIRALLYAIGMNYTGSSEDNTFRRLGVRYLQDSMERGNTLAKLEIATLYWEGDVLDRDYATATNMLYDLISENAHEKAAVYLVEHVNFTVLPDEVAVTLQRRLRTDGYYQGAIDGAFGPQSRRALGALIEDKIR